MGFLLVYYGFPPGLGWVSSWFRMDFLQVQDGFPPGLGRMSSWFRMGFLQAQDGFPPGFGWDSSRFRMDFLLVFRMGHPQVPGSIHVCNYGASRILS